MAGGETENAQSGLPMREKYALAAPWCDDHMAGYVRAPPDNAGLADSAVSVTAVATTVKLRGFQENPVIIIVAER